MPRTTPGRKVSHGAYWQQKFSAAETPMARFGEASDYFRAALKRCRDQGVAAATLQQETDRLISLAGQLMKVSDPRKEAHDGRHSQ